MTTNTIWFENPVLAQRVRFNTLPADSGGRRFVLEYIHLQRGGAHVVPAHVHASYVETFEILAGRARYRLGSDTKTATAGDRIVMPAGTPHVHPWSDGDEELHVRQTTESDPPDLPGLNASLQAAITILGLARSGRVNAKGLPNLLQLAVILESTMPASYVADLPMATQRILFGILGRIGRLARYKAAYPEYGVLTPEGLTLPEA